ncbi:MAG: DUF3102 domain-containing protein [Planctomycetaceae bacterium]|nr:DUF3102 domain-containing protein [Planctomycetaceae bacterium]
MVRSLPELAEAANESHLFVIEHGRKTVEQARMAGAALAEAKQRVRHGEWRIWLQRNCPGIGYRTAARYMQIHRDLPAPNVSRVSHLVEDDPQSIRQALELVQKPKAAPSKTGARCGPFREWSEDQRREWMGQSWGWESVYEQTLLLTAMDWTVERIADLLFVEVDIVNAVLNPVAPTRFDSEWNGRNLFDEHVEQVSAAYRANVESMICGALRSDIRKVLACSREELPPGVAAELRGVHRHYERRCQLLEQHDLFKSPVCSDADDNLTLWVMAFTDCRAALRVETVKHPGRMSEWFDDVRKEVVTARTRGCE